MTKTEERKDIYPKLTAERSYRQSPRGQAQRLSGIDAAELCDLLAAHGLPIDPQRSTQTIEWRTKPSYERRQASLPLGTTFPEGALITLDVKTIEYYLWGRAEKSSYALHFTHEKNRSLLQSVLQAEGPLDHCANIVANYHQALDALAEKLKAEYDAEQKADEERRKREFEMARYVDPESFGGSDF